MKGTWVRVVEEVVEIKSVDYLTISLTKQEATQLSAFLCYLENHSLIHPVDAKIVEKFHNAMKNAI